MTPSDRQHLAIASPPPPPSHLSAEAVALWTHTVETWDLSRLELELLAAALGQLDTHRTAMAVVRAEGAVVTNPESGNQRAHPALAAANAALRTYRQCLTHLDLELEEGPRPRASGARRRGPR